MRFTIAWQAGALDPVALALKDVLAAHRDAAEEERLLSAMLASNAPFLMNAFRYYYQVCAFFSRLAAVSMTLPAGLDLSLERDVAAAGCRWH